MHPHIEDLEISPAAEFIHTYECKDNEVAYFKVDVNLIRKLPVAYLGMNWKYVVHSVGSEMEIIVL